MWRVLVVFMVLAGCSPEVPKTSFVLSVQNIATAPVTGPSGDYQAEFSAGWARVSVDTPLFVPGAFADERLAALGTAGDALGYVGTEGAPFPTDLAATYADERLLPAQTFVAEFDASPGAQLSFGCMFGPSNDTIAGAAAFPLFDGNRPFEGDLSSRVGFYDLGVEENEEPGFGANQPARGTGGTPEHLPITLITGTDARGNAYPDVATLLSVRLEWKRKL